MTKPEGFKDADNEVLGSNEGDLFGGGRGST